MISSEFGYTTSGVCCLMTGQSNGEHQPVRNPSESLLSGIVSPQESSVTQLSK